MAKFFQRKEKPAEKPQDSGMPKGMRALTPEEARKAFGTYSGLRVSPRKS